MQERASSDARDTVLITWAAPSRQMTPYPAYRRRIRVQDMAAVIPPSAAMGLLTDVRRNGQERASADARDNVLRALAVAESSLAVYVVVYVWVMRSNRDV